MGVPYSDNDPSEWKSTIVNSVTVYEPTTNGADINTQGNITASGNITGVNITAWAVTATHNFLDQSITDSTPLATAGLATPGIGYYKEGMLSAEHNISLPKAGSTSHFVSPNQPIFTFTKPTRVRMIITISSSPGHNILVSAGWNLVLSPNPLVFRSLITNHGFDYLYEKIYPAGTHNLDPNALTPVAFYLFENNGAPGIGDLVKANTELLSATPGIATGGKALILHSSGDVGIGTTGAPDTKLHVVGDIKATGTITGQKQFYQTFNGYFNNNLNSLPVNLPGAQKLNNNGLAREASNWYQYPSWLGTFMTLFPFIFTTDPSMFEDAAGGVGVKVKVAGFYKATCQMHFYSQTANTSVAIRFAKNALVDDVQDQDQENPGPCQMSPCQTTNTASSACLDQILLCAVDDVISVYTSKAGVDGTVVTAPTSCSLRVEFFGFDG